MSELRDRKGYESRQVAAARRVLVDVGQVLAAYRDSIVLVGGWVPEIHFPDAEPDHIGSVDVDLALDAKKLDSAYAELITHLLDTGRYQRGGRRFQLIADVDLKDDDPAVRVEIDFLAPKIKLKKNKNKLIEGFRVLQFEACAAAFYAPVNKTVSGEMISGAKNQVCLQVASPADFLVMKAHALGGREKPKDAYDLCYCLEHDPQGLSALAAQWVKRIRKRDVLVEAALEFLQQKFASVDHFGPRQLAAFYPFTDEDERDIQARRGFEFVQDFISAVQGLLAEVGAANNADSAP